MSKIKIRYKFKKDAYPIMKLLVDKLLCFSFDLYNTLLAENSSFVFSPFIMFKLLGILLNAAEGETREYLQSLLYQKDDLETINQKMTELDQAIMISRDSVYYKAFVKENPENEDIGCMLNNFIFYDNKYNIKSSFSNTMENSFGIIPEPVNLQNSEEVIKRINKFVSDSTKGYISDCLTDLNKNFYTMIINTIFFKGSWCQEFDKDTRDENFYVAKNNIKTVPMMKVRKEFTALDNEKYQAIQLFYNEDGYSFLAVMPKKNQKLSQVSNEISEMGFDKFISTMERYEVDLKMPKFKIETKLDFFSINNKKLNKVFSKLNELSMLENDPFQKIKLLQKAIIDVNEKGTVAAAANVFYSYAEGLFSQLEQISITFNKPFLYFIIKSRSENLDKGAYVPLFMGQFYGN